MRTAAVAFVLACLVSALLTPLVRRFALKYRLFDDHASARRVHGRPIPRLGGVAIAAGFYAPVVALLFAASGVGSTFYASSTIAVVFLIGGGVICALGLYDDIWGSGAMLKFAVQFLVAGALYYFGFRIDRLSLPFLGTVSLGSFGLILTLLWIVGVINAMNLIDGLDGLAAGVGLFGVATAFLLAAARIDPIMMLSAAALGGALVGFLVYNFNPASIFMGDTGSMFLGYVLAVGAVRTNNKSSTAVAILVPIVALGVPIADTLLAMVRRAVHHRPLFSADRAHIHHKLLDLGLTQRQAVLILYAVSLLLGGTSLLLTISSSRQSAAILVVMGVLGFLATRKLGYGRIRAGAVQQEENKWRRHLDQLAGVDDEGRLWRELKSAGHLLGLTCIRLDLAYREEGDSVKIRWECGSWGAAEPNTFHIRANEATITVEFESSVELPASVLEALGQAVETACNRTFGKSREVRASAAIERSS